MTETSQRAALDDAAPSESGTTAGLLSGYLVVELADLSGQLCGRILGDLGAEVIKIEPIEGDPVRRLSPRHDGESLRFAYLNSGKRSVVLDLETSEAQELLRDLVASSDILITTYSESAMASLGLPLESLTERFPRLVDVSITGFGRKGPYSQFRSPDIVAMAMGGLMGISGAPDMAPVHAPETQAYYFANVFAAQGALLGLFRRESNYGRGGSVDVSIVQAMASIEQLVRIYGHENRIVQRTGSQHKHVAPARIYPTSDGFVSLFVTDHHWEKFLALWPDRPADLDSPELLRTHDRMAQLDVINKHVRQFASSFTTHKFVELMNSGGVPCTPVNSLAGFLADPQTTERKLLQSVNHPGLPEAQQVGFPALLDRIRPVVNVAPRLGEHTRATLVRYLRLTDEQIDELARNGTVGS